MIRSTQQSDWILGNVTSNFRIVVPQSVVVQPRLLIVVLPRKPYRNVNSMRQPPGREPIRTQIRRPHHLALFVVQFLQRQLRQCPSCPDAICTSPPVFVRRSLICISCVIQSAPHIISNIQKKKRTLILSCQASQNSLQKKEQMHR